MKYNGIDILCSLAKGGIIDNWYAAGTIKKFGLREIDYV